MGANEDLEALTNALGEPDVKALQSELGARFATIVADRFSTSEVALLADVLAQVAVELDAALDAEQHPRGRGGELIVEEATRPKTLSDGTPDHDRIFEMHPDGRISTLYPRMSLETFEDRLPGLIEFLRNASLRGLEVAIVS